MTKSEWGAARAIERIEEEFVLRVGSQCWVARLFAIRCDFMADNECISTAIKGGIRGLLVHRDRILFQFRE